MHSLARHETSLQSEMCLGSVGLCEQSAAVDAEPNSTSEKGLVPGNLACHNEDMYRIARLSRRQYKGSFCNPLVHNVKAKATRSSGDSAESTLQSSIGRDEVGRIPFGKTTHTRT